ncbi:MAG: regulatory iron-sulfur-containing complex subunit RicT [Patescibacteria group bacterium]
MKNILIRARSDGKVYSVDRSNQDLDPGDKVLFESDRCQEIAQVISESTAEEIKPDENSAELIRRLNEKDLETDDKIKAEARENLDRCRQIVEKHQLPMELLDADLSFDGKKLTFYFSAPGRVDFRSLVSELASTFQKLIRLQQVGARDRARCVGGIGRCGQDYCCKRFLKGELDNVTVDMAYEQNLAQMGSNRVTGACGKLMCCLKYELGFYEQAKKKMPRIGSQLKTAKGTGTVVSQCFLKNKVTIQFSDKTHMEVDC